MTINAKDGPSNFTIPELWAWCYHVRGEFTPYGEACSYVEVNHLAEVKKLAGIPEGLDSEDPCGFVYGGTDYQPQIEDAEEKLADKYGYRFDVNGRILGK